MKSKRNGSAKNSPSQKIERYDGYSEFLIVKRMILKGDTKSVIFLLEKLLNSTYRLQALLELCNYYFYNHDVQKFEEYAKVLELEQKDINILDQIKRMRLYLQVNILKKNLTRNIYPYYERQIISYQKEELLAHLKTIRFANPACFEEKKFLYFWDPDEMVAEIGKNLRISQVNWEYDAIDKYYMYLEKCGIAEEKIVSTVEITTVKNTFDIIDLIPSNKEKHRRILIPNPEIKLHMKD